MGRRCFSALRTLIGTTLLTITPAGAASAATGQSGACAPMDLPTELSFDYKALGTQFLAKLQTYFWDADKQTYYETISCGSGEHGKGAYMWTEDHAIGALYWGSVEDPTDFRPLLGQAIVGTQAYARTFTDSKGTWTAYAVSPGSKDTFFDDNALYGTVLTRVFLHELPNASVLTMSKQALNFVYGHRQVGLGDGTPEKYADPLPADEVGEFYAPPILSVARSDIEYGAANGKDGEIDIGLSYFNEVTAPALGLLQGNGLYIKESIYDPTTKTWTPVKGGGDTGSSSTDIAELALALYRARGDAARLSFAENLMPIILNKWYTPGAGVNQVSVYGAQGIVCLLCELYMADHNVTWYNDAKNIIDFLLAHGRDTAGFFADGTTDTGKWNIVRTGQPPDATVTLLTQTAAAAAILEFAYIDQVYRSSLPH